MHAMKPNRWFRSSGNVGQILAFGVVSLGAIGLTAILSRSSGDISQPYLGTIPERPADFFEPFVGDAPPLLAIVGTVAIGAGSLAFLRSRGWFNILAEKGVKRGLVIATVAGTLLSVEAILVEASGFVRFDEDLNVPLPWSLLFYPVIAYVVEIVFHVLPLALLLAVLGKFIDARHADRLAWTCIVIVAFIEPLLQLSQIGTSSTDSRTNVWLLGQVAVTNLVQLSIFRRYGFVSMLSLRLAYYSWWHVLWGHFRVSWLF